MSVVDLIHERDQAVRLIWEQRCCDCKTQPLIAAVYLHEGARYLYLPAIKGPHVSRALRVRRRANTWPLADAFRQVSQCSRCRTFFLLSSAPVPTRVLVMTFHGTTTGRMTARDRIKIRGAPGPFKLARPDGEP